jgi:preprotein translocase subunit SecD
MSKKKLGRTIVGCIIAIIVVIFIAGCGSLGEPSLSLTYQADVRGVESGTEDEIMEGIKAVIERRINALGYTESTVQIQKQEGEYNIVIQIFGNVDIEKVIGMVGLFTIVEFREQDESGNWTPATGTVTINGEEKELVLSSRYFKENTYVDIQTGRPLLLFEMNETGAQLFRQISTRLIGKRLAIFLGDEPLRGEDGNIIAPEVMEVIEDRGQIKGLSLVDAQELSRVLNAGRIDVPLGRWMGEGQSKVFEPNVPLYVEVVG